jgi:predicted DCC family thiol-disulfide oxidoreductase YuxK
MMGDSKLQRLTVYYDGSCPSCVRDRCSYEKWAGDDSNVAWVDITGRDEELLAMGVSPKKALTELHVADENQQIYAEIDAYRVLMDRVPRLKPLSWLVGLPVIRPVISRIYHWQVHRRLRREGRL